jgi:hypothetical protein
LRNRKKKRYKNRLVIIAIGFKLDGVRFLIIIFKISTLYSPLKTPLLASALFFLPLAWATTLTPISPRPDSRT